jgi:hypothetical protein
MKDKILRGLLVLILSVIFVAIVTDTRFKLAEQNLGDEAKVLIDKAGGSDAVCREAHQIFSRFGGDELWLFNPSDLKDFPAISALGHVECIIANKPAVIQVRVRDSRDGYIIHIANTNSIYRYQTSSNTTEVVRGCVFVIR